ncbi:hypothetical protein B7494_g2620 [Chlorociboria aeruginascens]|nr:hypothetical protein B7494_g2620 [Chlorociboria aeruginascens]
MRTTLLLTVLLTPFATLAAPPSAPFKNVTMISKRQAPTKPQPCQPISPEPTYNQTEARFNDFANQFIVLKNITAAFAYIEEGYINHDPYAQNGFDSAWNILSPIWGSQSITVLGTAFNGTQGWLHYTDSYGTVVDRYRWDGGCIAEHWDQGETFPS